MVVREAVIAVLKQWGVDRIFGNPGSTELPMFRDYPSDMEYILALQEASAVAMADGFAQAGNRLGVVSLHSAAGVGNAMGNIYTAFKNNAPLLLIAGQQARAILPFAPFLFSENPELLPQPYVKWSCQPASAEEVPAAVAKACAIAMQHPRGPVLVSVPVDDWDRGCNLVPELPMEEIIATDTAAVAAVTDFLQASCSPALVVGGYAADAWDELVALAEQLAAPVWVAPFAHRTSFPENHPLFAGFLPAMREGIVERLSPFDTVLVVGAPVFTYHIEGNGPHIKEGTALLQLVNDVAMADRAAVGESVVADVVRTLQGVLTNDLPVRQGGFVRQPLPAIPADEGLTKRVLMQALARALPEGGILVEESPSTRSTMHDYLPVVRKLGFYTCASGGLGYSLPAAAGVAMAEHGTPVLALMGDGSSLYSIQALWNMVQAQLPIVVVIVNNGRYQALGEFSEHFGLTRLVGTELPGLDFLAQAKAYGMEAVKVVDRAMLDESLRSAFAKRAPILLDIHLI